MDESLLELENELKRLSPRRPSRAMLTALERELAPRPGQASAPERTAPHATTHRPWQWAMWSLAGVAAIVALALALQLTSSQSVTPVSVPALARQESAPVANPPLEPVSPDRFEPVQASSVLYAMQESPPATLPDRSEGREVRYRFVDTYTWKNPARNASMRWSVPRDEVRLVRANLD